MLVHWHELAHMLIMSIDADNGGNDADTHYWGESCASEARSTAKKLSS